MSFLDYNIVLTAVGLSWLIAQFIKFVTKFYKDKKINFKIFLSMGGMPSAHAAVVSSLSVAIGILEGFNSTLFAISVVLAVIVIYDALGVRRAAGDHAHILNKIIKKILKKDEDGYTDLRERLGHKTSEVILGSLLGTFISLFTLSSFINFPGIFKSLFSASYIFDLAPGKDFKFYIPLLILLSISLFVGILIWIFSIKKNPVWKKLLRKFYNLFFTFGIIGYLLLLFRYENAYFLSMRFLWIVLLGVIVVWKILIIRYILTKFKKDLDRYQDTKTKEKYMPLSNKK